MDKVLTDCFWCGETYELGVYDRCPKCSTDIDTKSIRIIAADELAAANGENETTS